LSQRRSWCLDRHLGYIFVHRMLDDATPKADDSGQPPLMAAILSHIGTMMGISLSAFNLVRFGMGTAYVGAEGKLKVRAAQRFWKNWMAVLKPRTTFLPTLHDSSFPMRHCRPHSTRWRPRQWWHSGGAASHSAANLQLLYRRTVVVFWAILCTCTTIHSCAPANLQGAVHRTASKPCHLLRPPPRTRRLVG